MAMRELRHHGLCDVGQQKVFCTGVVSRLNYTSIVRSRFVTAADIERIDAFLSAADSARQTYQTPASSWRSVTSDFSIESAAICSMSYIACCRHHLPPLDCEFITHILYIYIY